MAAYCFFDNVRVIDAARLERYRAGVLATVRQYQGRYLLVGGKCEVMEGQWRPMFPVIIEFPSLEQAHRWYNSDEYRDLKALRGLPLQGVNGLILTEYIIAYIRLHHRVEHSGSWTGDSIAANVNHVFWARYLGDWSLSVPSRNNPSVLDH